MKTIYRCDMCGNEFNDWQECAEHERAHPKIEKTTLEYAGPNDIAPEGIKIQFDNGAIVYFIKNQFIRWPEQTPTQKENPLATGKED